MSKRDHGRYEDVAGEEFARRGNRLLEERVRPHVDAEREARKFVAIDTSGAATTSSTKANWNSRGACLLERRPEAKGRI